MPTLSSQHILALATFGRIAYMGKAPGTNGALIGLIVFALVHYTLYPMMPLVYAGLVGLVIVLAIWICGKAERLLGKRDPAVVILDEAVALPLCFLGFGEALQSIQAAWLLPTGFILFRFFDIVKPWPIHQLQALPGGLGVVVDDLAAALATAGMLHTLHFTFGLLS